MFRQGVLLLAIGLCQLDSTSGFVPSRHRLQTSRPQTSQYFHASSQIEKSRVVPATPPSSTQLFAEETKLWDRMEIEEDEEPMWYVLNCVAGLEIDLLRQCRQRCEDMDDVEKFVVPMVTNTRSHGANRMVKDTKVKYQGYVFAKLRLCPETYTSVQGLDLCRSWMGTINYKGHKKLPPAPVALNEEEIENFGLEDLEAEEPEEPEDDIILDSEEADQEAAEMEETVQTVYKGLRVEDMVKVTAKNKFFDEDAIVRRLKDGKVFLRFYTYGSMYEEWMDPGDVRKLSNVEILKGMSGPQQPITQQDFDGPNQGERRSRFGDDRERYGNLRRNQVSMMGGGPRNRRQDRNAGRFQRDSDRDQYRNDENWNWYKDNERRKGGSGYQDGEYELRGSSDNNDRQGRRDDRWAQGDVDSQWGRKSQRQNRREGRQRRQESKVEDDWSAFVSPASKKQPTKEETDDFFASLMTDLSNDLEIGNSPQQSSGGDSRSSADNDGEDDFFASLMSEIEEQDTPPTSGDSMSSGSEDDFFASLEEEIRGSSKKTSSKSKKPSAGEELDDFFSELGSFDDSTSLDGGAEDFFAGLEAELESELSVDPLNKATPDTNEAGVDENAFSSDDFSSFLETSSGDKSSTSKKETSQPKASSTKPSGSAGDATNLQKLTVPVLKGMLKERGLKVSGKKAELIERLSAN